VERRIDAEVVEALQIDVLDVVGDGLSRTWNW